MLFSLRRAAIGLGVLSLAGCASLVAAPEDSGGSFRTVKTSTGSLRLAVQEEGRGSPVLLLHGMGASSYTWRALMPRLAVSHRVIAVDLRGFGRSDKPQDSLYSVTDQAAVIQTLIEQEKWSGLTVIGHSFGGGVALALALGEVAKPQPRIRNLVLIDTIAYRQKLPVFFRLLQLPVIGQLGMSVIPAEIQASQALRSAYYNPDKISDRTVEEYARPLRMPDARHAFTETVNRLIPDDIDTLTERYKTLKLPVQIIWCEADRIVPVALGRRLQENLPGAVIAELEECGHLPQEEKPEETSAVVERFLARNSG